MKAKDISEKPILDFLQKLPLNETAGYSVHSRYNLMTVVPEGTPVKVFLAKMKALKRRGLVNGCCCGCRGDFCLKTLRG